MQVLQHRAWRPRVYIYIYIWMCVCFRGRYQDKLDELTKINPSNNIVFVETQVALISGIEDACKQKVALIMVDRQTEISNQGLLKLHIMTTSFKECRSNCCTCHARVRVTLHPFRFDGPARITAVYG
jgi:hypothetical protein